MDFCGKSSGFADFGKKTQWIVDHLRIFARIADGACLDVCILGPKKNLNHRSFFSLGRHVNEFIQIIFLFFSNEAHLISGARLLLELYCVIVIKHVAFFTLCNRKIIQITLNVDFSHCGK